MTNFMPNPTSNILVMRLADVVVVLTQSLHILFYRGKHSENCYLSSPTMQSEQNFEGMPEVPWTRVTYGWPEKTTMHYADDRQPSGRLPKKLCDVIRVDMKSLIWVMKTPTTG